MPPTKKELQQKFINAIGKLKSALQGRENSPNWIKPDTQDSREIAIILRTMPVNLN